MCRTPISLRYTEIWSTGSQYASNWNAFLFLFIFCEAPDPCEGAICRIHYFCQYNNSRFDTCNCTNPWNGTNCTGKIVDPIAEAANNGSHFMLEF